jgi:hypothetical protein
MPPKYGQGGVVPKHLLRHCKGRGQKEGAGNRGRERDKARGRRREDSAEGKEKRREGNIGIREVKRTCDVC